MFSVSYYAYMFCVNKEKRVLSFSIMSTGASELNTRPGEHGNSSKLLFFVSRWTVRIIPLNRRFLVHRRTQILFPHSAR